MGSIRRTNRARAVCIVLSMTLAGAAGCTDGDTEADTSGAGASGGGASSNASAGGGGATSEGSGGATTSDGGGGSVPGIPCVANGRDGECAPFDACTGLGQAPVAGFCPGPADIQCCAELPAGTCDPDATPLPNFDVVEPAGQGGCLPGMIAVGTFCIDVYEGALVRFPDLGPVSPYFNPGDEEVVAVSAPGLVPQGYIDEVRASDACTNAGKRLCSDAEWLRACEGPSGTTYPYGDMREPGVCNDARAVHPAVEYFMTTDPSIYSELDHPCLNQLADGLDTTGANPGCVTAEGAFDMMGNLHEWTADPNGTFRGGFYVDTKLNGNGCLYVTTAHDVSHFDYSTGFRCCADL